jgi:AraC-like DNA-binding protein
MEKKEILNLIMLNVARKEHDADWNWKGVNSPFARLYMVENGMARVVMPDGAHTIQPGYLYLIPAFVTHSYENDLFFTLCYIHVYDEYNIFDRWDFPFEVEANELDVLLIKRLLAINPDRGLKRSDPVSYDNHPTLMQNIVDSERFSFKSAVETKGILLQLFSKFLDKASPKQAFEDKRITRIIRHIRENVHRNIPLEELSSLCYVSNDHFIRLFKKEMHCSPLQYINRKKIEKAQLMLVVSNKSLKDIAHDLSFRSLSYFHRLFKRFTGSSPSRYRDMG